MRRLLLSLLCLAWSGAALATDYYVSATASAGGNGTFANPWQLGTAIGCGQLPHGGDTIWVRGGTYVGHFTLCTSGNSTSPLIVRNYNGERVIIDGSNIGGTTPIILLTGNGYVWWWGMELMSTDPVRVSTTTLSTPPDITRPDAFDCYQRTNPDGTPVLRPGFKIINNVIHDDRQGIGNWEECTNLEFTGNLSFHHGWTAPDRGHGHGTYSHNTTPSQKRQAYNIIFSNFGLGIQIYGSSDIHLDNFEVDHNIIFNAGGMENSGGSHNLLYGGYFGPPYVGAFVHDNSIYRTGQTGNQDFDLGYVAGAGLVNPVVTGNKVAASVIVPSQTGMTLTGNTFWTTDVSPSTLITQFPSNSWNASRAANDTEYYPNPYESGRCNVALFNWTLQAGVGLDMSQCALTSGVNYEVHAATNFYGPPVTTFTYNPLAPTVNVNTSASALPIQMPVGCPDAQNRFKCPPVNSAPEFCVYIVIPAPGGAATPTPTNTVPPSSTPTATVTPTPTQTATATLTPTKTNTPLLSSTPTPTATVTSTPTITITPVSGQCTYIEAEASTIIVPAAAYSDVLASGGLAVTNDGSANNGTAEFTIDGGAGGSTVYVWHKVLADTSSHDSFFYLFNNNAAGDAANIDDVAEQSWGPNWQWTRMSSRTIAGCPVALNPASCQPGFTLSAGANTLRFRWRDAFSRMDLIAVCPNQGVIPQPTATPTATATPTFTPTPSPTFTPSNTPGQVCVTTTPTP